MASKRKPRPKTENEAKQCARLAKMLRGVPGGIGEVIYYLENRAATLKAQESMSSIVIIFDDHRSSFLINKKDYDKLMEAESIEEAKMYLVDHCMRTEINNATHTLYADDEEADWEEVKENIGPWYG